MFIERLNYQAKLLLLQADLANTLARVGWPEQKIVDGNRVYHANQLGLTYRPGSTHPWYDASGSLYDKELKHFTGNE